MNTLPVARRAATPSTTAAATYAARQPFHSRSSTSDLRLRGRRAVADSDLVGEAPDELVERDAALGLVAAAGVHADRAGGDVVVADDQHVRDLLQLGVADPLAELVVGVDDVDPAAGRRGAGRRPCSAYSSWAVATGSTRTCTGASHVGNAPA